jgi:hypothetical protein
MHNVPKDIWDELKTLKSYQHEFIRRAFSIITGHVYKPGKKIPDGPMALEVVPLSDILRKVLEWAAKEYAGPQFWNKAHCPCPPYATEGCNGNHLWNPYVSRSSTQQCRRVLREGRVLDGHMELFGDKPEEAVFIRSKPDPDRVIAWFRNRMTPELQKDFDDVLFVLPLALEPKVEEQMMMQETQPTPSAKEAPHAQVVQGGAGYKGVPNQIATTSSVPVLNPAVVDAPSAVILSEATIPSMGLHAGRMECIADTAFEMLPLLTKPRPLTPGTQVGSILGIYAYGPEIMHYYLKFWCAVHAKWGGNMKLAVVLPQNAGMSGRLALTKIPRRAAPALGDTINRTLLRAAPTILIDVSVGGTFEITLEDIQRSKRWHTGLKEQVEDEDMVAVLWVYSDLFSNMPNNVPTTTFDILTGAQAHGDALTDFYATEVITSAASLPSLGSASPLEGRKVKDVVGSDTVFASVGTTRAQAASNLVTNSGFSQQEYIPIGANAKSNTGNFATGEGTSHARASTPTWSQGSNGMANFADIPTARGMGANNSYTYYNMGNTSWVAYNEFGTAVSGGTQTYQARGFETIGKVNQPMKAGSSNNVATTATVVQPAASSLITAVLTNDANIIGPGGLLDLQFTAAPTTISGTLTGTNGTNPHGEWNVPIRAALLGGVSGNVVDFGLKDTTGTVRFYARLYNGYFWTNTDRQVVSSNIADWTFYNVSASNATISLPPPDLAAFSSRVATPRVEAALQAREMKKMMIEYNGLSEEEKERWHEEQIVEEQMLASAIGAAGNYKAETTSVRRGFRHDKRMAEIHANNALAYQRQGYELSLAGKSAKANLASANAISARELGETHTSQGTQAVHTSEASVQAGKRSAPEIPQPTRAAGTQSEPEMRTTATQKGKATTKNTAATFVGDEIVADTGVNWHEMPGDEDV